MQSRASRLGRPLQLWPRPSTPPVQQPRHDLSWRSHPHSRLLADRSRNAAEYRVSPMERLQAQSRRGDPTRQRQRHDILPRRSTACERDVPSNLLKCVGVGGSGVEDGEPPADIDLKRTKYTTGFACLERSFGYDTRLMALRFGPNAQNSIGRGVRLVTCLAEQLTFENHDVKLQSIHKCRCSACIANRDALIPT